MNRLPRTTLLGISDGLSRGLLLFLLGEYIVSDIGGYSYTGCLVAAVIFAVLSILLFFILSKRAECNAMKFYGIGQISFLLSVFFLLVNYIEVHIYIFSRRELTNGDGIILLLSYAIFILPSEVIRLIASLSMVVYKKLEG